jgi:hypothetical protein
MLWHALTLTVLDALVYSKESRQRLSISLSHTAMLPTFFLKEGQKAERVAFEATLSAFVYLDVPMFRARPAQLFR